MPTYNFKCPKCNHMQSIIHSIKEDHPKVVCEKCKTEMKRNISSPAVVFKGTGWACQEKKDDAMMKSLQPAVHAKHQRGEI